MKPLLDICPTKECSNDIKKNIFTIFQIYNISWKRFYVTEIKDNFLIEILNLSKQ